MSLCLRSLWVLGVCSLLERGALAAHETTLPQPAAQTTQTQPAPVTRDSAINSERPRGNMDTEPGIEERKELGPTHTRQPPYTFLSLDSFYFLFGMHTGFAWLNDAEAKPAHIGTSGPTAGMSIGFGFFDLVTLGADFEFVFLKDHASFEEDVVPFFGPDEPPMSATSSLSFMNYSVDLGLRTPSFCLTEAEDDMCLALHAFTNFGKAWITAERSINHCGDCTTQHLDLNSGAFLEPGLALGYPSRRVGGDLRASFRRHLGDATMASELRIGFSLMIF